MSYTSIILESIIVGVYSVVIYLPFYVYNVKLNSYVVFSVGFLKHFLGYYSGLQSYYCYIHKNKDKATNKYLFLFSVAEGLVYITLYSLLFCIFKYNAFLGFFYSGVILHILAEITGIHNYFLTLGCFEKSGANS